MRQGVRVMHRLTVWNSGLCQVELAGIIVISIRQSKREVGADAREGGSHASKVASRGRHGQLQRRRQCMCGVNAKCPGGEVSSVDLWSLGLGHAVVWYDDKPRCRSDGGCYVGRHAFRKVPDTYGDPRSAQAPLKRVPHNS